MDNTDARLRAKVSKVDEDVDQAIQMTVVEGQTFGQYVIGPEIGNGGMGTVYHAKDTSTDRSVVIKVVKFPTEDPEHKKMMRVRFRREAKAACKVPPHPNVVTVFAFEEFKGLPMLVMELIDGRTVRDLLVSEFTGLPRAMEPRRAVKLAIGTLNGLEAIHRAKIVHRDLKPGNVMVTHDDQVKIVDFGLGKASESFGDPALDMTLTQANMPLGSPSYMSPEQTKSLPVSEATDIYAVGVILFQMLTGKAPFMNRDAVIVYEMHRSAPVPMIHSPHGPIPAELDAVVRKAMAKAPGDRYASASAMRAALEAVDFDPKPKAVVKPPPPKTRSWILPILALSALAALVVALVVKPGMTSDQSRPGSVVQPTRAEAPMPSKAVAQAKASDGIEIPPPPPPAASVAQGCELYTAGQTTEAIATLTRALAAKPNDAEGLYCLCGSYVRQKETRADAQKTCKAYRTHPARDAGKTKQVDLWIRRISN